MFGTYLEPLRDHLARRVPVPAEVDDLCAEVMAQAYRRRAALAEMQPNQTWWWLRRTANNFVLHHRRGWARRQRAIDRLGREQLIEGESIDDLGIWEANVQRSVDNDHIREVLADMRPEHREILELDAIRMKGPQIALRLGVSHQQARTRLMQARQAFRRDWLRRYGQASEGGGS